MSYVGRLSRRAYPKQRLGRRPEGSRKAPPCGKEKKPRGSQTLRLLILNSMMDVNGKKMGGSLFSKEPPINHILWVPSKTPISFKYRTL